MQPAYDAKHAYYKTLPDEGSNRDLRHGPAPYGGAAWCIVTTHRSPGEPLRINLKMIKVRHPKT